MKFSKYIIPSVVGLSLAAGFSSCSEDELGPTIFPDVPDTVDPSSVTYKFDTWLNKNFRDEYNLNIFYKMKDVEADMNYNLVPATLENAENLSLLTKYLWFDAYKEATGDLTVLKTYGPRIIHLIGSPAYNPTQGTEILGLAEGGLKVSLFKVNEMVLDDINMLNEYYFRTMHHEFGHILHQTKSYPTDFNLLSNGRYDNSNWQNKNGGQMASLGFITPYASSENREDFAETIANYITRTDEQLGMLMWSAAQGWSTGEDEESEDDSSVADEKPYYCYYYFVDAAARAAQQRTYILEFVDRPVINGATDYRVGLLEGDNIARVHRKGVFLTDSVMVKEYVAELDQLLRNDQLNYEAQNAYQKRYDELTDSEKRAIDRIVEEMTFVYRCPDTDNIDGAAIIRQKQNIVRTWFKDVWGLDFDNLREIVQHRQATKDEGLDELRAEVEAIQ